MMIVFVLEQGFIFHLSFPMRQNSNRYEHYSRVWVDKLQHEKYDKMEQPQAMSNGVDKSHGLCGCSRSTDPTEPKHRMADRSQIVEPERALIDFQKGWVIFRLGQHCINWLMKHLVIGNFVLINLLINYYLKGYALCRRPLLFLFWVWHEVLQQYRV